VRKLTRFVAIMALVALVGTTAALAYGPVLFYAQRYNEVKHLRIYDNDYMMRPDEGIGLVRMPSPADKGAPSTIELQTMRSEKIGTIEQALPSSASVLPGKGGMQMLTNRERTQNEVRRLVRSLD